MRGRKRKVPLTAVMRVVVMTLEPEVMVPETHLEMAGTMETIGSVVAEVRRRRTRRKRRMRGMMMKRRRRRRKRRKPQPMPMQERPRPKLLQLMVSYQIYIPPPELELIFVIEWSSFAPVGKKGKKGKKAKEPDPFPEEPEPAVEAPEAVAVEATADDDWGGFSTAKKKKGKKGKVEEIVPEPVPEPVSESVPEPEPEKVEPEATDDWGAFATVGTSCNGVISRRKIYLLTIFFAQARKRKAKRVRIRLPSPRFQSHQQSPSQLWKPTIGCQEAKKTKRKRRARYVFISLLR